MKQHKSIKRVVYPDNEFLNYFIEFGYNIEKDFKKLKITEKTKAYIAQEVINNFNLGYEIPVLYKINEVSILKMRVKNPKNKKGKSSGFRILVLLVTNEDTGLIFHIYDHTQKDNISEKEKNNMIKLVNKFIE